MPCPNFFIIGAPKCGAETVATWLSDHPDVFFPETPLANHFATDLADRIDDPEYRHASYASAESPVIGECSPWYLYSRDAVANILEAEPRARFVVCLRNPVDMAWVLHSANVAEAIEHVEDFPTAWAMSDSRRQAGASERGVGPSRLDYASVCALGAQLLRLGAQVDIASIHLVFLDDILEDPAPVWRDLQAFLEINETPRDSYPLEESLVERPLSGLHAALRLLGDTRRALLPQRFPRLGTRRVPNERNRRAGPLRAMPREPREKVCERLSDEIGIISAMSGRDLAAWIT